MINLDKVTLTEKFSQFSDYWNPRIAGELNGQQVKLAKFKGAFIWHQHEHEDEFFLVVEGSFRMELRDKTVILNKGDFMIVPRGTEHRPVAEQEAHVLLFEPMSTINTGTLQASELTRTNLERL
jgi:mannose-6-phosphate isomerase-like protein (cupin superfamily)